MILSLDALKEMGAFTGAPVEKEITWKKGDKDLTATVFIRPLSYHSAVSDIRSINGGDPTAGRIAACVCDEHGKAVFTPEDVTGEADPGRGPLDGPLTMALLKAIYEVNDAGKQTDSAT